MVSCLEELASFTSFTSVTGLVTLGCTKMWNFRIRMALHWQPPDLHNFDTDPSLHTIHMY